MNPPDTFPDPQAQPLLWLLAGPRRPLVPSAALTARLLQSPLFHGCGDEELMVETPSHAPAPQRCANRLMLVRSLALALEAYDTACKRVAVTPAMMQEQTRAALEHLQAIITLHGYLRRQRRLKAPSQPRKRPRTIEQAFHTLLDVTSAILADDYADLLVPMLHELLHADLCAAIRDAFAAYGPSSHFPAIAQFYASAQVLIAFEIDTGSLAHVAARLQKRTQRTTKPRKGSAVCLPLPPPARP